MGARSVVGETGALVLPWEPNEVSGYTNEGDCQLNRFDALRRDSCLGERDDRALVECLVVDRVGRGVDQRERVEG